MTKMKVSEKLTDDLKRVLAHQPPEVVGAALGQMLAIYIAGHHPSMRDDQLDMLVGLVRNLVPIEIEIMIEAGRIGPEWRDIVKH